jgi:hypothetical protein
MNFIQDLSDQRENLLTYLQLKISRGYPEVLCRRALTYLSDMTGFDWGKYFEDPNQVRDYFRIEVMERLYPGWSKKTGFKQADLDEMFGAVIHHKWRFLFLALVQKLKFCHQ